MIPLLAWFRRVLVYFGFLERNLTIAVIGLDNAGKTSFLHRLRTGKFVAHVPTEQAKLHAFQSGGIRVQAWDIGGHESAKRLWSEFMADAAAIVFVIDTADTERIEEALKELENVAAQPAFATTPIALFGNKRDLPVSRPIEDIVRAVGFIEERILDGSLRVFNGSVLRDQGMGDVMRFISSAS